MNERQKLKLGSINYAVILARSGSKSIKDKNITHILGRRLISYVIDEAKKSKEITKIFVLTDSKKYQNIFLKMGVEVPFLRPKNISTDSSKDIESFYYFYKWLESNNKKIPDLFVHLRATAPLINFKDIDLAIKSINKKKDADSLKSIRETFMSPYKMWSLNKNGFMKPILKLPKKNIEAWNMSRHDLPKVFWQDAQIDIVKRKTLANLSMSGKKILPYFIKNQDVVDVDNKIDLLDLEIRLNLKKNLSKIVFDIDGVIATIQSDLDYSKSKPIKENIKKINNLYFQGIKIIFNTSRGFETGKDWKNLTRKQLKLWGVKYHKLYFVKPNGDLYIDDKAMLPSALILNNFKKKIK